MLQRLLLTMVVLGGVLNVNKVWADTANLNIAISIQPSFTLDSVDAVSITHAMGVIGVQSQTGQIQVTCCNTGQTFTIAVGAGLNASGFQRRAYDGMNHINYDLLKQSNGNVWGTSGTAADTSMDGAAALSSIGIGAPQVFGYEVSYNLTGAEPAGNYTDSVLITVEL